MHLRLLGVSYGHADHTLFENITLELFPHERVALLGRNGEGKTSVLRLLAGLERPSSGTFERIGSVAYLAQREAMPHHTLGKVLWPEALEKARQSLERTTLASRTQPPATSSATPTPRKSGTPWVGTTSRLGCTGCSRGWISLQT